MIIYILIFSLVILLLYVGTKSNLRILKYIGLCVIISFAGFRYRVGRDFQSYWWIYESIDDESLREPAYQFIGSIFFNLGFGAQINFLFMSCITILFIWKALQYYDPKHIIFCLFVYLFVGLFFDSFNLVRQSVATSIFLYSTKFIYENKPTKYIVGIIFAACFHFSALILIPFYFLLNRKYNTGLIIILFVISLVFSKISLLNKIMPNIPMYAVYFDGNSEFNFNSHLGLGFYSKYIIGIIVLCSRDRILTYSDKFEIAINGYFWYLILMGALQEYMVFLRIAYYFHIFIVLLLPAIARLFKDNGSKQIVTSIIICYCGLMLVSQTLESENELIPYGINFNIYQTQLI